jgi:signal transduction histidine kinase
MGGLLDLLQNAAESRRTDAPVRVRVQTRSVDRYTEFSITGNGQAIAPSALPDIGKAFYTSRLSEGGSGLGLSVVHGIVGDHSEKLEGEALPDGRGLSHSRATPPRLTEVLSSARSDSFARLPTRPLTAPTGPLNSPSLP